MNDLADVLADRIQLTRELEEARSTNLRLRLELSEALEQQAATSQELQESLEYQTATGDVLKVISRSVFDLQTVLDTLTESAARLCGADTAIIRRRRGDEYPVSATYGLTAQQRDHMAGYPTAPDRGSLFGRAVIEGRTIHVPDVLADPEYNRPNLQAFVKVRAMLGVPLMRDGVAVGVFTLQRREPQPYKQQQIELVTTFADQAVIAIENVRLFGELQARTEELGESLQQQTATAEVLKVISRSAFDLQRVLDTLAESAARLCEADIVTIWRPDGAVYRLAATYQATDEQRDYMEGVGHRPGRGSLVGRALLEASVVHIHDTLEDSEYLMDVSRLREFRTQLGVPFLREGVPIGVIALIRRAVRPFTEKHIELATTFADQAVIAIENVRLFEAVQARTAELTESLDYQTATSEVLDVMSQSPTDAEPVFKAIVQSAARLCGAVLSNVQLYDGELLHIGATHNFAPDALESFLRMYPRKPDRSQLAGRAILSRKIVHVHDVLSDPDYAHEVAVAGNLRAMLSVPMFRDRNPVGVITVVRREAAPFSQRQIELLKTFADQAVIAIGNVGLFEEVQTRTAELQESLDYQTATSDVLNIISRSAFDLQPVLKTLVETAGRLCQAENVQIWLREGDMYHLAAHNGFSPEYQEYARRHPITPSRGTLVARTALEVARIHIPDVLSDPEYTWFEGLKLAGFRTMLGVPLLREGSCIGVMAMTRGTPRPFSDKQIELVTTFADQAVIAIENVRLFDEVQTRTRELTESLEQQTATSEVLQAISRSTFDLQAVLETLVQSAARLCEADIGTITRQKDSVYYRAALYGFPPDFADRMSRVPVELNKGTVTGRALVEGSVVHVEDVTADTDYEWAEAQQAGQFRTLLGVPLLRQGTPIGAMALGRRAVRPFTERQIELVRTFADQAVIAIENVRLFEEVQARTAELQESLDYQTATSDVLNVISRSPNDLEPVLDTIVDTASRLCDAYDATLVLRDGEWLRPAAHRGPILLDWERLPISRDWVTGRAVADRLPVHIHDLQSAAADFPSGQEMALRSGLRAVLAMPLLREKAAIGAILLRRTEARPFSQEQIALLQTFADQAVIAINNVRLFEAVQERTAELQESLEYQTATSDVLNVISRSPNELQPVLDAIVQTAAQLCAAEYAFIARPYDGKCHLAAANNVELAHIQFISRNPVAINRDSILGRVALDRRTIHAPDVLVDPEFKRPDWQEVGKQRTVLGVPLMREGTLLGVIILARTEVRPFTKKQIDLATTFADQAVIAINNVGLFEEVQARTRELSRSVGELRALGEVSHAVNSTLDLETVLSTIVAKAVQLSSTEAGAIYVFSKLRQKFRLRATYGMSEAMIAEFGSQSVGLGESYIGSATSTGEAVQVPDLCAEPPSSIRDLVLSAGYRALLVVPLMRPDRVVGALVVRRKEPGLFPSSTIDLLQTFAAQSVVAVQNARLFEDVEARTRELAKSLEELRAAQERLIQTEKLASLGQLTAGIAHEIKNPLNFVNNFAALSIELIDELKDAIASAPTDEEQTAELMELLAGNLGKVVQHGKRADSIVKNMLLHSRAGSGERRLVDINALVEESLNLAYHGARAEKQGFNVTIERSFDPSAGEVSLLPQEITRVFLNLISNGFYANIKRKERATVPYEPTLIAATQNLGERVEIRIRDNGTGITPEVKEKMFDPFFTTKPAGEGTGLGLSLSHDIVVKQHGGSIEVDTSPGEYTEFRIVLPRSASVG